MALRCFIAIGIPAPVRESLGRLIGELRETGADVKWVPHGNIHITLKFLGSTEEAHVDEIRKALEKKLSSYKEFYITISSVGTFPSGRHPRILWVGIDDTELLREMQKNIDREMVRLGYPGEEREFSPHLTIGRVRSQRKIPEVLKKIGDHGSSSFGSLEVKSVLLMKSELKPAGAEYQCLAEIPFGGRTDVK